MGLPTERDYDATDTGSISHTTVNNLQDAIVSNRHGLIDVPINLYSMERSASNATPQSGSISLFAGTGTESSPGFARGPMHFAPGTVIEQFRVRTFVKDTFSNAVGEIRIWAVDTTQNQTSAFLEEPWTIEKDTLATGGQVIIDSTDLDNTSTARLPMTITEEFQVFISITKPPASDNFNLTSIIAEIYRP